MFAPRRRSAAAAGIAAFIAAIGFAAPATAHVTVRSDDPVRGATDSVLTFRTPNEMSNATTVELRVFLPTDTPLLGVLVKPIPGWTFRVRTVALRHPIRTDDGDITSAVSEVVWSGGRIPVGGYQDFDIAVGQLPQEVSALTFKALQTYSNGTVVRWIETAAPGSAEPEHPAPILQLAAPSPAPVQASTGESHDGRNLAILALAVALIALWSSVAGRIRRGPQRR